jgi:hypothetical protein
LASKNSLTFMPDEINFQGFFLWPRVMVFLYHESMKS